MDIVFDNLIMSLISCNYNTNKKVNVKAAQMAALAIPINNMFF